MKKIRKKNLKPIDIDAHFKYVCPNVDCGNIHWLSLLEAKTNNFKIVCYCGTVSKPRTIKKIKIEYVEIEYPKIDINNNIKNKEDSSQESKQELPLDLLQKCVKTLVTYGFTEQESNTLIHYSFNQNPTQNISDLIKLALQNIGELENVKY
jgi:Holliday junction resolvasome RuvABC DNA-binding subunit